MDQNNDGPKPGDILVVVGQVEETTEQSGTVASDGTNSNPSVGWTRSFDEGYERIFGKKNKVLN